MSPAFGTCMSSFELMLDFCERATTGQAVLFTLNLIVFSVLPPDG